MVPTLLPAVPSPKGLRAVNTGGTYMDNRRQTFRYRQGKERFMNALIHYHPGHALGTTLSIAGLRTSVWLNN